jgi:hypothetical protein
MTSTTTDCVMISDAELIALWHTKESRSKIAARVQMSRKELQREWRRLQIAGALPMGERISSRRHYATTAVVVIDGRPRVGVLGKGDDPLLKRLRQEYEDDGRFEKYCPEGSDRAHAARHRGSGQTLCCRKARA